MLGALGLGFREKLRLEYVWQYYDRFYPEPTELQKTLTREALSFKENAYVAQPAEIGKIDPETQKIYEQMYRLPPQRIPDPDENPNAGVHQNHW